MSDLRSSRPELLRHVGPDNWPRRWQTQRDILDDPEFNWFTFRQNKQLMNGLQTSPSRLDKWLTYCARDGVPERHMVDSEFGSPYGEYLDYGLVTASSAKNAWYAWQIAKRYNGRRPIDLLEMGGGYGGLVRALHMMLEVRSVVLLDSDVCTEIQTKYLRDTCPEVEILSMTDTEEAVDLVTNTMSFGEMKYAQVKMYFDVIQSHLREGGVFYTANRVQREVNFSAYPYDANWRHEINYMPNEGKKAFTNGYISCYSVRDRSASNPHPVSLLRT